MSLVPRHAPITEPRIHVPAGWFSMGSDVGQAVEAPVHRVWVDSFDMAATQVTVEEYARFLDATGIVPPPYWDRDFSHPQQPVVAVSWYDAVAYCAWLSAMTGSYYRLPTEAECAMYAIENSGDCTIHAVRVELKCPGCGPTPIPLTPRDALTADAVHTKLALETDDVRILEITLPPHSREEMHTDAWPAIVFVDQPTQVRYFTPDHPPSAQHSSATGGGPNPAGGSARG